MALLRVIPLRTLLGHFGEGLRSELGMLLWISSQPAAKLTFTGDAFPGQDFEYLFNGHSVSEPSFNLRWSYHCHGCVYWSWRALATIWLCMAQRVWTTYMQDFTQNDHIKRSPILGRSFLRSTVELSIRGTKDTKNYKGIWASFITCSMVFHSDIFSCNSVSQSFACTFPSHKIWNRVMGIWHAPWTWRLLGQILLWVNSMFFFQTFQTNARTPATILISPPQSNYGSSCCVRSPGTHQGDTSCSWTCVWYCKRDCCTGIPFPETKHSNMCKLQRTFPIFAITDSPISMFAHLYVDQLFRSICPTPGDQTVGTKRADDKISSRSSCCALTRWNHIWPLGWFMHHGAGHDLHTCVEESKCKFAGLDSWKADVLYDQNRHAKV